MPRRASLVPSEPPELRIGDDREYLLDNYDDNGPGSPDSAGSGASLHRRSFLDQVAAEEGEDDVPDLPRRHGSKSKPAGKQRSGSPPRKSEASLRSQYSKPEAPNKSKPKAKANGHRSRRESSSEESEESEEEEEVRRKSKHKSGKKAPPPSSKDKDKVREKVLGFKQQGSFTSQAHSQAASSTATSEALGHALLAGAEGSGLGLANLNRKEWSMEELSRRGAALPVLKVTLGQIDGRIKPKFSHFAKHMSPAENLEQFGINFYQELFDTVPELKNTLFKDKPTELLAIKLGTIMGELIRLLELPSPQALAGVIAEMALRHIEYGLERGHAHPFQQAMVATIKKTVVAKGHKWSSSTGRAWNWALKEIINLLVEATEAGRPKVQILAR